MKKWLTVLICNAIPITMIVLSICLRVQMLFVGGAILIMFTIIGSVVYLMYKSGQKYKEEHPEECEKERHDIKSFVKEYFLTSTEKNPEDEGLDERTIEEKELEEINNSYGIDNREAMIKRTLSFRRRAKIASEEWPNSYWGCAVVITFGLCLLLILVFFILLLIFEDIKYLTITLSIMGVGAGIIVLTAIIITVNEKRSMWRAKKYLKSNDEKYKSKFIKADAVVFTSLISSFWQIGHSSPSKNTSSNERVISSVYKILIECGDKKLTAYSKNFYNTGEKVEIIYKEKSNLASIIADNLGANSDTNLEDEE